MSLFVKILLIIVAVGIVGGVIISGVYWSKKQYTSTSNLSVETSTSNSNASQNADAANKNKNQNSPTNQQKNQNANATSNTNNVIIPSPTPTPTPTEDTCEDVEIEGTWSLVTDLEGATFTPPYANQKSEFEFKKDGTVNFTESYNSEGTVASAKHTGSWKKEKCNFSYEGTADGSGVDEEAGSFTLHFDIKATGIITSAEPRIEGDWVSNETYVSLEDTTKQVVTGTWIAVKLTP